MREHGGTHIHIFLFTLEKIKKNCIDMIKKLSAGGQHHSNTLHINHLHIL